MTESTRPYVNVPRESLANRISQLPLKQAALYAKFIMNGDVKGHIPCWGGLTDRFLELFPKDDERLMVLSALIEEGDPRPLIIFLETSRNRPQLLKQFIKAAYKLPVLVQRVLVSLPEAQTDVAQLIADLDPSARAVWEGGEAKKRAERELHRGLFGQLMSIHTFTPDAFNPRDEPPAHPIKKG